MPNRAAPFGTTRRLAPRCRWWAIGSRARIINREQAIVEAVLPRRTLFARRAAGRREDQQPIAANIDLVFLVCGLDGDFNLRRLERYLTLGVESGADAVVVLNKSDLCADVPARLAETAEVAGAAPVVAVHTRSPEGARAAASISGRGAHGGAAGVVGRGQIFAGELPAWRGAAAHRGGAGIGQPRAAYDDAPGTDSAAGGRRADRHAGDARVAALGGRGCGRPGVRRDRDTGRRRAGIGIACTRARRDARCRTRWPTGRWRRSGGRATGNCGARRSGTRRWPIPCLRWRGSGSGSSYIRRPGIFISRGSIGEWTRV